MNRSLLALTLLTGALCVGPAALARPTAPAPAVAAQPSEKPAQPEAPKTPAGESKPAAQPAAAPAAQEKPALDQKFYYVKLATTKGDIVIELNNEKAPISTKNFLSYVDNKFYDGTIFHRVIPNFMVQGGGFNPDMSQKPTEKGIKNEWQNGLKNVRGSVAMARTMVADSGTSQFFINVVDNAPLDQPRDGAAYAVFGKVLSGMDVVDKIKDVKTANKGQHQNVPVDPIVITSATRMSEADAKATVKK